MNFFGLLMVAIGANMALWGTTKSQFIIYRLLCARSKPLWGENVHQFYQLSGITVVIVGLLLTFKVLGDDYS